MSQFVTKDMAILDEHELRDEDGNLVLDISPERLRQIAKNNNKLIDETGDEIPIVIGHTKDDGEETDGPEIVGYASRFRVAKLFNSGRKAIWVTAKFFKDKIDLIRKFPRRSVEFWLRKQLIDPISLLGATSPERHLGLLKFSHGEQHLSLEAPMDQDQVGQQMPESEGEDALVQKVIAALQQSAPWKYLEQMMQEHEGGEQVPEGGEGEGEDELPLGGEGEMPPEEGAEPPVEEPPVEEPKKMNAGAPSGSNTFMPGSKNYQGTGDKVRLQRDQLLTRLSQHETRMKSVEKENADLKVKLASIEVEKQLIQLESEGFMLERAEEMEDLIRLSPKARATRLELIRKNYRRMPVTTRLYGNERVSVQKTEQAEKERASRAIALASAKGMTYEQALQELSAN